MILLQFLLIGCLLVACASACFPMDKKLFGGGDHKAAAPIVYMLPVIHDYGGGYGGHGYGGDHGGYGGGGHGGGYGGYGSYDGGHGGSYGGYGY